MMDRQQAVQQNIIHDEDHARNRRRLTEGLYGRVAERQNCLIAARCLSGRTLDVGAGYGNLARALRDRGMQCVGIEIDPEKIKLAKEWYDVDLLQRDIHHSGFGDNEFDTVVFREVVRHLRLDAAMQEAGRIASKRVLVFQANPMWALRLANRLLGHREQAEYVRADIVAAMQQAGFAPAKVLYSDCLAFPLSGGYIGPQLVPRWRWLYRAVLALDRWLSRLVAAAGLGPMVCCRMLIVADKAH
jgi:SAM-dependent methyltransferase